MALTVVNEEWPMQGLHKKLSFQQLGFFSGNSLGNYFNIERNHLQCTVRNMLLVSFPQTLLASHLYSPLSFLLT